MGLDAAQQAQRDEEEKQNEEALKAILLAQGTSIEVILMCINVQPHAADITEATHAHTRRKLKRKD